MQARLRLMLMRRMMLLSDTAVVGPMLMSLASQMAGSYKDRRILSYLTAKPYVSRRAVVRCQKLQIGNHCFIDDFVNIYCSGADGEVKLGNGVHLYRGTNVEVGTGGRVEIGDNTHVQGPCDFKGFGDALLVGADVQIAPFCSLSSYNHAFEDLERPIHLQGLARKGATVIEDDVWLGAGVKVLAGVRIGKGAVVGAGSVVTKDIPPCAIAVGVPATVIRSRGTVVEVGR